MKRYVVIITFVMVFCLSIPTFVRAQNPVDYGSVEQKPLFCGGDVKSFEDWVYAYLKYPESASVIGLRGTLNVWFVIDTDGTILVVRPGNNHYWGSIPSDVREDCETEVIRVISSSPKWEPGRNNGVPVRVRVSLNVLFDKSLSPEIETITVQSVGQKPTFKGGDANNFASWLTGRICAPRKEGRVVLSFVVTHEGEVENVKIIQGLDPTLDEEIIRVASDSPLWSPGRQNGKPVTVEYTSFPVDFRNISFKVPLIGTCWEVRKDASWIEEGAEDVTVYQFVSESKYIRRNFTMYKQTSQGREIRETDAELTHKFEHPYTVIAKDIIRVWDNFGCYGDIDLSLVSNAEGSFLFAPENTSYPDEHEEIRLKQIKEMPHETHLSNPEDNRPSGIMTPPERQGTSYSEREVITFSTPLDVFNFLQSRVFKSSDGITLDITPYGVKANGRAITGAVKVTYIQRQQAIMKATSPAGHTYTFIAYADRNCIVCDDDHTMYLGKK